MSEPSFAELLLEDDYVIRAAFFRVIMCVVPQTLVRWDVERYTRSECSVGARK